MSLNLKSFLFLMIFSFVVIGGTFDTCAFGMNTKENAEIDIEVGQRTGCCLSFFSRFRGTVDILAGDEQTEAFSIEKLMEMLDLEENRLIYPATPTTRLRSATTAFNAIPELNKNFYALRIRRGLKYINNEVQGIDLTEYPMGNVHFVCNLLEDFKFHSVKTMLEVDFQNRILENLALQVGGLKELLERRCLSVVQEDNDDLLPLPGVPTLALI